MRIAPAEAATAVAATDAAAVRVASGGVAPLFVPAQARDQQHRVGWMRAGAALLEGGASEADIDTLLVDNPRRYFE